jgi:hypothetical protein
VPELLKRPPASPASRFLLGNCQSSVLYGSVGSGQVRLGSDSGECGLVRFSCGLWNDRENDRRCSSIQRMLAWERAGGARPRRQAFCRTGCRRRSQTKGGRPTPGAADAWQRADLRPPVRVRRLVAAGLQQRRQGWALLLDLGPGPLPPSSRSLTSGPGGVLIARGIGVRRCAEGSPQHAKGDAGAQERLRRSDHADDPDKGAGQRGVVGGGGMQPGQVGAEQPDLQGSASRDAGETRSPPAAMSHGTSTTRPTSPKKRRGWGWMPRQCFGFDPLAGELGAAILIVHGGVEPERP